MSINMKNLITGAIILVIGIAVGYGLHSTSKIPFIAGSISPTNSFQSEASIAQATIASTTLSTITGTSTSMFNGGYDRAITSIYSLCTGVTSQPAVSSWGLTAATSSAATTSNTAYAVNLTLGTTTSTVYTSSTTYGNDLYRIWPGNTYLDWAFNATDTASCDFGVQYITL